MSIKKPTSQQTVWQDHQGSCSHVCVSFPFHQVSSEVDHANFDAIVALYNFDFLGPQKKQTEGGNLNFEFLHLAVDWPIQASLGFLGALLKATPNLKFTRKTHQMQLAQGWVPTSRANLLNLEMASA